MRVEIVAYIAQVIEKVLNESPGDESTLLGQGGVDLDSLSLLDSPSISNASTTSSSPRTSWTRSAD